MKLINIAVALTMMATLPFAVQAGERHRVAKDARHQAPGMQVVEVSPSPGEPAHGWQYFSDSRKARAVVISPNGDYFYSRGDGLQLVYKSGSAT